MNFRSSCKMRARCTALGCRKLVETRQVGSKIGFRAELEPARLAPFPPQIPRKLALLCSTGSLVLRHSPTSLVRACPLFGLWPLRTGLVLSNKTYERSPSSRACCFSACAGSQTTQDRTATREIAWLPCCLPPSRKGVGILIHRLFEAQSPGPLVPLVYASRDTSRCPLQDSRPGWSRCSPFL